MPALLKRPLLGGVDEDSNSGAAQPTSNFRIVGAVEPLWTRTGQLRHVAEERLGCQAALASTPEEATVFVGRYLATGAGRGWRLAPSTAAERCEEQRFLRPVDAAIAACADFWGLPIRERPKIVIEALDRLEPRADDAPLPALTAEEEAAGAAREDADRIAVAAHLERERAASEAFERREAALFEEDRRIKEARAIWHETVPGAGTLTERYITDIRGILGLPEGWSDIVRWHPKRQAVVLPGTNAVGELQFVHQIFLDRHGRNILLPLDKHGRRAKKKLTKGVMKNAWVRLPATGVARLGLLITAEGAENGLTDWVASGRETCIACGSLTGRALPRHRQVIVARDDDKIASPADFGLERALTRWRSEGVRVAVAIPWPERRGDKSDTNDVSRQSGIEAVRRQLRAAELEAAGSVLVDPPMPPPSASVAQIRTKILHSAREFFARRDEKPAPQMLLLSAAGTGKSDTLARYFVEQIKAEKGAGRPHRLISRCRGIASGASSPRIGDGMVSTLPVSRAGATPLIRRQRAAASISAPT